VAIFDDDDVIVESRPERLRHASSIQMSAEEGVGSPDGDCTADDGASYLTRKWRAGVTAITSSNWPRQSCDSREDRLSAGSTLVDREYGRDDDTSDFLLSEASGRHGQSRRAHTVRAIESARRMRCATREG